MYLKSTKYFFFIFVLSLHLQALGDILFKSPHSTLAHPHPGCPEDSICSKKIGEAFQEWIEIFKQNNKHDVLKKKGFPFTLYTKTEMDKLAHWDSKCFHHKTHKIFKAMKFLTSVTENENQMNQVIHLKKDEKTQQWITYQLPIGFTPMLMENDSMIGLIEWEGEQLVFKFTKEGNYQLLDRLPLSAYQAVLEQNRVACPSDTKTLPQYKEYFLDHYCQTMLDDKGRVYTTMRYWTCP